MSKLGLHEGRAQLGMREREKGIEVLDQGYLKN